jgi:hypothetical protein
MLPSSKGDSSKRMPQNDLSLSDCMRSAIRQFSSLALIALVIISKIHVALAP